VTGIEIENCRDDRFALDKSNKVVAAFEVESTTTMTSGLVRGSNLSQDTEYMIILRRGKNNFNGNEITDVCGAVRN